MPPVVEETLDRFGRIDSFCANAMVTVYREARELDPEELRRVVDVNFLGAVNCYWASLAALTESHGTFVHVNSALAYRGIPLQAAYCSSKAAGRTFFESARVEHEKHRIPVDVSLVLPGAINTPQFDTARQYIGMQPQPVPPIYQPELFAAGVVHCFEHPVRELPLGWGAQKLLWGQKLLARAPATSSCCGAAGRASTRASRSRWGRRTTCSSRFRATAARTAASTRPRAPRRSGRRCGCGAGSSDRRSRPQPPRPSRERSRDADGAAPASPARPCPRPPLSGARHGDRTVDETVYRFVAVTRRRGLGAATTRTAVQTRPVPGTVTEA